MMKKSGDFEKFKRNLKDVIDSFERAKEWADLSNCLQKVKKQFELHSNTEIPLKKDLAKRLAQCLNPDLAVIHQNTLEIYALIFQRQIELNKSSEGGQRSEWGADLGLFLSGLYNFYQFAAFEVKDQFLNIVDQYILSIDKELLLSLPGFMICMLPALEDQNADKLKRVEEILKKTEQTVGTSEFYGEIWKAMLRTNRTRLSAIKYLEKRIPRDLEAARELGKKDQIYISRYKIKVSPPAPQMKQMKDGSEMTKVTLERDPVREEEERKHLALNSLEDYFYFYYPMKEKLCINSLLAGLADSSNYVNRGVLDFLITHAPITGRVNKDIENVKLVEGALNTLNKKDFAFLKKFFTWVLGHLDNDEDCIPEPTDPAIKTLVPALQCVYKNYLDKNLIQRLTQKEKASQYHSPQNIPILITQILFNDNAVIIEPILLQISVDIIKYIKFYMIDHQNKDQKNNRFNENVKNFFDMVPNQFRSIWTALGDLLSREINENNYENVSSSSAQLQGIELIDFCLRDLRHCFERKEGCNLSDYIKPILSLLLSGVAKLSNSMNNLENVIPALELIENILSVLHAKPVQKGDVVELQASVNNFNTFYVELCKLMTEETAEGGLDLKLKLKLDTFKKASKILTQIQEYSNIDELNSMPAWLSSVINCSKTRRAKIALISIETFLTILSKDCKPNEPVKKLQILIVNSSGNDGSGGGEILQMGKNRISGGGASNSIYQTLQETRNHHCTDIIKTLWYLLDEEEDHQRIVILLKIFDGLLPAIFSEVVINDLKEKAPREVKERGIKKFSIFWNLTAQDYPQYRPFYEKDTTERRYGALHNVLHFLEQNDPTLRLSCKSWLSESKYYYNRILNPLVEEFLLNSKVFVTFTKQIFFYDMYDTKIVIENFGKLRNIILNTQDEMINYMITKPTSDYIQKDFEDMFSWLLPRTRKGKNKYLEVIVYITLQFIMGQAVQSVDQVLYQESQTVNASACEFMELILKSLESHPKTSNEIAHIIVDPILRTFKQVIDNQNHAMQVHLLNLLKVIFFQCNFQTPESKENCERIFKDPSLIDSIIKGMKNEVSFVRYHFIQFATTIMESMKKYLKAVDFTKHITKLIECFSSLMQHVDVSLFSNSHSSAGGGPGGEDKNPLAQKRRNTGGAQFAKQKTSERLVINQESDIAYLIAGFKKILTDSLGIYMEEGGGGQKGLMQQSVTDAGQDPQYKQAENTGIFGKVSKLWGGGNDAPVVVNTDEQVIRDAIYNEFKRIIVSCLHCWNDLPIFTPRDFHFTRTGVFPYSSEDDKLINAIIDKSQERFKDSIMGPGGSLLGDFSRSSVVTRESSALSTSAMSQQPIVFTLQDYIKMKADSIQWYILDFLKPLTDTSSNQLIEGILMVWMDKKNLDHSSNLHKQLEKIMQVLQSVKIKHYHVIECLNQYINKKQWKTTLTKSNKKQPLKLFDIQRETLLCQFLYTYLVYNIQQTFNKGGSEDAGVPKLYKAVLKFIHSFKESRHPPTQSWLLEILNILAIKFSPMDAYRGDQKLKKEYYETLTEILTASANILSDNYKVSYDKNYGFLMAFPPQSYELMQRFSPRLAEFTSYSGKNGGEQQQQALLQNQQKQKKALTHSQQPESKQMMTMKKPGAGINLSQHQQPKMMQPLPSPSQEDVEDDEEFKGGNSGSDISAAMSSSAKENIGIGSNYGMKIGGEQAFPNSSFTQAAQFSYNKQHQQNYDQHHDPDYINNDLFFEEGSITSKFMVTLSSYINYPIQECPDFLLTLYHRLFTIITLKGCLYNMVFSIIEGHNSHTSFEKIQSSLKIIVDEILKILSKKEEKEKDRLFYREAVTDFFASLMDVASQYLVKRYKQEISEIFFHDNFFQMSRRNLRKWTKIINHFISDHKDAVFDDLLYKWNTQAGLLTTTDSANRQKVIALKRVSFLVFSGNIDQYDDKLDLLLKKMTEGLKSNKKNSSLLTQLFLLTRVLLLRLQTVTLTDALRKLWPHLLNELESIFREKTPDQYLIIEAIKVVELMSALNIEDFQMNQWIFLIDSYGMKLDLESSNSNMQSSQIQKKQGDHDFQLLDKSEAMGGGIFQPFILRFMQSSYCSFYDQKQTNVREQHVQDYVKSANKQIDQRKSSIQIDGRDFDKEQVLETFAIGLQLNLSELNTERCEIDKQNFEALIEKDFIAMEQAEK